MLLVEVESLRRKLGAETILIVCTDRGTWIEMDVDVADVPEGVPVYSNIRGTKP